MRRPPLPSVAPAAHSAHSAPSIQPAPLPTLALDIGGSTTRIGHFAAPTKTCEYTPLASFPAEATYAEQVARIARELDAARIRTGDEARGYAGIGVSFGGRITRDGQRVAVAPNLPDY